jgi:hypothetical protein
MTNIESGTAWYFDYLIHATARQRCEAMLMAVRSEK